jgi:hypothetical protein
VPDAKKAAGEDNENTFWHRLRMAAMAMMRGVDFSWGVLPHNGAFTTTDRV